jgi:hypothetical protein
LAEILLMAAAELESKPVSIQWHKHSRSELRRALGCDFNVLGGQGSESSA